jgi:hypothetical protein
VCSDGSMFVDRDGEHFEHVLEYMRDGVGSVAAQEESKVDIGLLRLLKREFGFLLYQADGGARRSSLRCGRPYW